MNWSIKLLWIWCHKPTNKSKVHNRIHSHAMECVLAAVFRLNGYENLVTDEANEIVCAMYVY